MSRKELGALVSRALAVWIVCEVLAGAGDWTAFTKSYGRDNATITILAASLIVRIGIALLLWFKAPSFGTWIGPDSDGQVDVPVLSKPVVATALLQGVAAYWVMWCIVELLKSRAFNAASTNDYTRIFGQNPQYYWGAIGLAVVAAILLFKAKDVARFL